MSSSTSFNVVGTQHTDNFAMERVLGTWKFPNDRSFPNMLYMKILSSPYAHAKITAIDASAALALPGVKYVSTYQDCPFFSQEVIFVGQEVAAVAATDPDIAEQALDLIKVTYSQLTYVFDPNTAMQAGAPNVGYLSSGNVIGGAPTVTKKGDVSAGFSASDVTVEDTFGPTACYQHSPVIPRSALAVWSADASPKLTVYTTSQWPFIGRTTIAGFLNLPLKDVRVINHGTGGGFGDMTGHEWCILPSYLSMKTGQPVLNYLSRKDNYLHSYRQYRSYIDVKVGAKNDGTFQAIQATLVGDMGGGAGFGEGDVVSPLQITYRWPNYMFTAYAVTTNLPRTGPWRCVGEPAGTFAMEQVIDELAYKLNMDPVQLRVKNVLTENDVDGATNLPFSSVAVQECTQTAASKMSWTTKWHAPGTKQLSDGTWHGIGVANFICNKGSVAVFGQVTPFLMSASDGTFLLNIGQSNINDTANEMLMIAAETLGITYDNIAIGEFGDTAATQDCFLQAGSSRTGHTGNAVIAAATNMKNQIFVAAAAALKTTPDQLSASNNNIFVTSNPTQTTTYAAVLANMPGQVAWGNNTLNYTMTTRTGSACVVEVAVDKLTGDITILDGCICDDSGTIVDPIGATRQVEGAWVQATGFARTWHQEYDANNGTMMNPDFRGHGFPTILDTPTPDNFTAAFGTAYDKLGPYGAKGLGEPPVGAVSAAVANAVYNAIGVRYKDETTMPAKVLAALGLS
jgi:xanthine dehydrogenase molybdenum-binding subunit